MPNKDQFLPRDNSGLHSSEVNCNILHSLSEVRKLHFNFIGTT
jgi:hypothetical protein